MASLWDIADDIYDIWTYGKGTTRKEAENIEDAAQEYQKTMQDVAKNQKTAKELYQEGKEQAAAMANNKAGIAARNAKAAAMQQSGSKLLSAIQGAQGAVDASAEGYDTTSQNVASLGAQQEAQKTNALAQGALGKLNAATESAKMNAQQAQDRAKGTRNNLATVGSAFIQGLGKE